MRSHLRVVSRAVVVATLAAMVLTAILPVGASAATPGPSEPCVAGTIWEDLSSGVKYICIYDELYRGTRWELLSDGQTGTSLFTSRSSIYGCTFDIVALTCSRAAAATAWSGACGGRASARAIASTSPPGSCAFGPCSSDSRRHGRRVGTPGSRTAVPQPGRWWTASTWAERPAAAQGSTAPGGPASSSRVAPGADRRWERPRYTSIEARSGPNPVKRPVASRTSDTCPRIAARSIGPWMCG